MLCLIDEPLGCAKTSGPDFLLALIDFISFDITFDSWVVSSCHISYAVKDKIAISKATVANYFPTSMFKT